MAVVKRIVFLGNNALAVRVLSFLQTQPQKIVGLVLHPNRKAKNKGQLLRIGHLLKSKIFPGDKINQIEIIKKLAELKPDILVSVMFGYILKPMVIATARMGAVNLHPAYLPYNRGAHPNVWSIIEETPAGVTLHTIDKGVDTGKILARKKIVVLPTDTGKSLYQRLEDAAYELFIKTWPGLSKEKIKGKSQSKGGTFHLVEDLHKTDEIDLDKRYKGKELINLLRARTFLPHKGVYFKVGGKKIFLQLRLNADMG